MELDPSQFLAQGSSDDESDIDDEQSRAESLQNGNGPPILTSLGLTHINSVTPNPFQSFLVSRYAVNPRSCQVLIAMTVQYFRIPTNRTMTKPVKCPATVVVTLKFLPTVPSVICSSRIVPMPDVTKRTFII